MPSRIPCQESIFKNRANFFHNNFNLTCNHKSKVDNRLSCFDVFQHNFALGTHGLQIQSLSPSPPADSSSACKQSLVGCYLGYIPPKLAQLHLGGERFYSICHQSIHVIPVQPTISREHRHEGGRQEEISWSISYKGEP